MPNLLFAILILALIYYGIRHLARANPKQLASQLRKAGGVAAIIIAIILTIRGGAVIAAPVFLFGLGLLGLGHLAGINMPFSSPGAGQKSAVRTSMIEMELDHDTGHMDGMVLTGRFEGRQLSQMTIDDLLALYSQCRKADDQSARLLEAYLERAHPDWQDNISGKSAGSHATGPAAGMTHKEALMILGLDDSATRKQIIAAHRRLMKQFHPDTGGSDYLAARINQARALLLDGNTNGK